MRISTVTCSFDIDQLLLKEEKIRFRYIWMLISAGCLLALLFIFNNKTKNAVTVPVVIDHNRMLVDAEMQRKNGSWRKVRLWIDTGNPEFFISKTLAEDLGIDLTAAEKTSGETAQSLDVPPPAGVRLGGMPLNFKGVRSKVMYQPKWLFSTMHNDANLPSTVLKQYQVIFDYPESKLTLAKPGSLKPRGTRIPAGINPETGIVQIDTKIDAGSFSFAIDNGASYSFVSKDILTELSKRHAVWNKHTGALACANIWGWWPEEPEWPLIRIPEIELGTLKIKDAGIAGIPGFFPNGMDLGEWYSLKTLRPVDGFLGPNALKAFRVEIDYINNEVYLEKGAEFDSHDMDIAGLTLRPLEDGRYQVIGIAKLEGKPAVKGVEPGDILLQIDDLKTTGATMGTVIDALRGKPGDSHILILERDGKQFRVEAKVERFL
ncbi:hypothetical protein ACFL4T_02140 [candidate division KSB1 bacterium]